MQKHIAPRSLLAFIVAAAMLAFSGAAISAQDEDTFTLGIVVVNCDIQPPEQITQPQDGCAPGNGIEFTATSAGGDVVGTCTSQIPDVEDAYTGGCTIEIPFGSKVIVTENLATVPAGYAPTENAREFTAPDGPPTGFLGGPVFINMLQDGDNSGPDVADDGLPDTGSGAPQGAVIDSLGEMLAVGAGLFALAGASIRFGSRNRA